MPRAVLLKLLEGLNTPATTTTTTTTLTANNDEKNESTNFLTKLPSASNQPQLGIGLDSCVIPLRHSGLSLIQTTDFFYPLIEDVSS